MNDKEKLEALKRLEELMRELERFKLKYDKEWFSSDVEWVETHHFINKL